MAIDPSIANPMIANLGGSMAQGAQYGNLIGQARQANNLRNVYAQYGPGIAAGDPAALNALAAIDPRASLGIQQDRLGMDATRLGMDATRQSMTISAEKLQMARTEAKRQAAEHARRISKEEAAAEAEKAARALSALSMAKTPDQLEVLKAQVAPLIPDFDMGQVTVENLPMLMEVLVGAGEGYAAMARNTPDPMVALDLEGKRLANQKLESEINSPPDPMVALTIENKRLANEKLMRELAGGTDGLGGKDKFNAEKDLRSEYNKRVESYIEGRRNYSTISVSAQDNTGAGDIALVTSFMKMLDPGSVVRETEFATARDTGGLLSTLRGMATKIQDGQFLAPQQRLEFENLARQYLEAAEAEQKLVKSKMESIVTEYGLSADNVFGEAATPSAAATLPEGGSGVREVEIDGVIYRVQKVE